MVIALPLADRKLVISGKIELKDIWQKRTGKPFDEDPFIYSYYDCDYNYAIDALPHVKDSTIKKVAEKIIKERVDKATKKSIVSS